SPVRLLPGGVARFRTEARWRRKGLMRVEQETVVRYDQQERVAHLWTAYPADARRWERLGYPVKVYSRTPRGLPHSWAAEVPIDAIRWRRVADGEVVRRRGHRKGRLLGVRPDELVGTANERSVGP